MEFHRHESDTIPCGWGSPSRWAACASLAVLILVCLCGCRWLPAFNPIPPPPPAPVPLEVPVSNPAHLPAVEPEFLWRQIVDTVDDYFDIAVEQPVLRSDSKVQEGRLETYPAISGTIFEPWRGEAARGYERLQSTIQTIRRTATIRVMPDASGYTVEVRVLKEKEDVDQSQFAAAGSASQRHDGTIVRNNDQIRQLPLTLGWYEIGRDLDLERRLIARILGRVSNIEKGPPQF